MRENRTARLARMSSFELYLRTGQRQLGAAVEIELKFNPWHDPKDGRFTYAQNGSRGTRQSSGSWTRGGFTGGGGGRGGGAGASTIWGGGVFTGGGGGSFGGAGATSTEKWGVKPPVARNRDPASRSIASQPRANRLPARLAPGSDRSVIVKNGYSFHLDAQGRTREIKGRITLGQSDPRSRSMQREAGGADRLPTDDGGHYIGLRFRGPREIYNHFAQDRSSNRGEYRVLENSWAKAVSKGRRVVVDIGPAYLGNSKRPAALYINVMIDGTWTPSYISNHPRRRK